MKLGSIHTGDIVECDVKGRRFFALVTGKDGTGIAIRPMNRETWRRATAREVIGHWRKSRQGTRTSIAVEMPHVVERHNDDPYDPRFERDAPTEDEL